MPSLDYYSVNTIMGFSLIAICTLAVVGCIKLGHWHKLDLFNRKIEEMVYEYNNKDNGGGSKVGNSH